MALAFILDDMLRDIKWRSVQQEIMDAITADPIGIRHVELLALSSTRPGDLASVLRYFVDAMAGSLKLKATVDFISSLSHLPVAARHIHTILHSSNFALPDDDDDDDNREMIDWEMIDCGYLLKDTVQRLNPSLGDVDIEIPRSMFGKRIEIMTCVTDYHVIAESPHSRLRTLLSPGAAISYNGFNIRANGYGLFYWQDGGAVALTMDGSFNVTEPSDGYFALRIINGANVISVTIQIISQPKRNSFRYIFIRNVTDGQRQAFDEAVRGIDVKVIQ